jgi:hypothetical protein
MSPLRRLKKIIPRINRRFVLVNFTNIEIWGKIMISKDGRQKKRGIVKNKFSGSMTMHCKKY